MTQRRSLTILAVCLLLVVVAREVRAAILPPCDQTVYVVQDPNSNEQCIPSTSLTGCKQMTPEQYAAQTDDFKKKNPPTITASSACGLNDFVQLFINLADWGLGIMAILALGFTIWGGQTLMTSAGNQEKVKVGKETIWGGILGISIVLTAWILVGFIVSALTGTGYTLFKDAAGGTFARNFFGSGSCGTKFKGNCGHDSLQISCKDTQQNGDGVSNAQTILTKLNCYSKAVDGCFGTNTDAAVKNFQKANQGCTMIANNQSYSMPYYITSEPDGIIGPVTWAFLIGSQTGAQMTCLNNPGPPVLGTCSGNSTIQCTSDSDCAARGAGTCNGGSSSSDVNENIHGC